MTTPFVRNRLWIAIFGSLVCLLELIAPLEYTFGYLYIIPILLAACELGVNGTSIFKRVACTSIVTRIGIFLTLFDFVVVQVIYLNRLNFADLPISTIVNRLSVVIVLWLTDWLIQRNLRYLEEIYTKKEQITRYQTELSTQLQIDRMQEDFIYTLTHDLKTPLLGAIQAIKFFNKEKFGAINSTQSQVLTMMYRSHQKSLQLVKTLLDVYRNDAEGLVLHRQPIDLRSIATEAIDTVVILGLERQITLNLKCDDSATRPPELTGDRLQLSRVFTNLLTNAIDHSPSGGRVDIIIDYREYQYIIQVLDRGRGIPSADLPFIFDRFYKAQEQLKGSGLGLHLSRQIIEAHGGEIWAESLLPQGAKFCFSLPIEI